MTQLVKWNLKNNTWILAEIINRVNKKVKENVIHKVNKCFYVPNISRLRNDSLTHILSFLRFLNGNWHKITAWQIQTINNSLQQNSWRLVDAIRVLYFWKRKSVVDFISLFFYHHYCNLEYCATIVQFVSGLRRCIPTFRLFHTHPRPSTPSQEKVTFIHPHPARKRSCPRTPTHNQPKNGHTQPKKGHTYPQLKKGMSRV